MALFTSQSILSRSTATLCSLILITRAPEVLVGGALLQGISFPDHPLLAGPRSLDGLGDAPLVLALILREEPRGLAIGGAIGVGVAQQALYGSKDGRHVVDRAPIVLQDVKAYAAVRVHIRMEELGDKLDIRRPAMGMRKGRGRQAGQPQ